MEDDRERLRRLRRQHRHGSELVEFTMVLIPFLSFMALILNVGWAVYIRATIQYAVAQGVRYAATSQTVAGLGWHASVQSFVQQSAFGALSATSGTATGVDGWNHIYVDCYLVNADGSLTALAGKCGMQTDGELPLVKVSVQSMPGKLFMPFIPLPGLALLAPIAHGAAAWDRMESPPLTGVPAP